MQNGIADGDTIVQGRWPIFCWALYKVTNVLGAWAFLIVLSLVVAKSCGAYPW